MLFSAAPELANTVSEFSHVKSDLTFAFLLVLACSDILTAPPVGVPSKSISRWLNPQPSLRPITADHSEPPMI